MSGGRFLYDAFNLRQREDALGEGVELDLPQRLDQWCHALNGCAAGDEPVGPGGALSLVVVADPIFKPLLLMLELCELLFVGCFFSFQFGDGFLFCHSA